MRFCSIRVHRRPQPVLFYSALGLLLLPSACNSPFGASGASGASDGTSGNGGQSASSGAGEQAGSIAAGGESSGEAGESGSTAEAGTSHGGTSGKGGGGTSGKGGGATAGAGGKPPSTCDCPLGPYYCQDGTITCHPCANFSRLNFAAPQKLNALARAPQSTERFPRSAGTGSALFYSEGDAGKERLWYAPSPLSGIGSVITESGRIESGPLLAPGFIEQNFFFDGVDATSGNRKIVSGDWANGAFKNPALAPEPYNLTGFDDYSVAVAPSAARLYWMSTRAGTPQLFTYSNSTTNPPPAAVVDLQVKVGAKTCPRLGDDATPWVNIDGTLLLFRSQSVNDGCAVNDSGAYDLFAVPLAADGTPVGTAVPLSSINNTGGMSNETDPSLSADACTIYFASDNGTGDYDLYRAARN